MAKQAGPFFITGCIDNLCFYKMGDAYYLRRKSSLDRRRVMRDKAFAVTMKNAELMGRGSSIASSVYRLLPISGRGIVLFRAITSAAICLLRKGLGRDEVVLVLKGKFVESSCPKQTELHCKDRTIATGFADRVLSQVFHEVKHDVRKAEPEEVISVPP